MSRIRVKNSNLTSASAYVINQIVASESFPKGAPEATYWMGKVVKKLAALQQEYHEALDKVGDDQDRRAVIDAIENELPWEKFKRVDIEAARCVRPLDWDEIEFLIEPEG